MNSQECPVAALTEFVTFWEDRELAESIGPGLTCQEAEALAALFTAHERPEIALRWINAHARSDEEGDAHHRTAVDAIRAQLEEIAASMPGIELHDGEPEAFGSGHLILTNSTGGRLSFTEITDAPADDPDRNVIGYAWELEQRGSDAAFHTLDTGRGDLEDADQLALEAWRWASS